MFLFLLVILSHYQFINAAHIDTYFSYGGEEFICSEISGEYKRFVLDFHHIYQKIDAVIHRS